MSNSNSTVPANQVFLVMGLEAKDAKDSNDAQNGFVIFTGVIAANQKRAGELFIEKNPKFELMSVSALSEMQDAVKLLTFVQEGKDLHDAEFPIPVYRDGQDAVDAGQFGL